MHLPSLTLHCQECRNMSINFTALQAQGSRLCGEILRCLFYGESSSDEHKSKSLGLFSNMIVTISRCWVADAESISLKWPPFFIFNTRNEVAKTTKIDLSINCSSIFMFILIIVKFWNFVSIKHFRVVVVDIKNVRILFLDPDQSSTDWGRALVSRLVVVGSAMAHPYILHLTYQITKRQYIRRFTHPFVGDMMHWSMRKHYSDIRELFSEQ